MNSFSDLSTSGDVHAAVLICCILSSLIGFVIGISSLYIWQHRKDVGRDYRHIRGALFSRGRRNSENGNIFLTIFAGIAMVGILGAAMMNFMQGPLKTSVNLTRQNVAETQMMVGAQVSIMAAANTANSGDCDADGMIEPLEYLSPGTTPVPVGGGLIPMNIGIRKTDPWGTAYGYCVWDYGTASLQAACQTTSGTNKRLQGSTNPAYPVVALVSAGPDKTFTTTCRNFSIGATRADQNNNGVLTDSGDLPLIEKAIETDDDIIFSYTYQEAMAASGGLWTLKPSDPAKAVITKDLEVTGGASFTGTGAFSRLAAVGSDFLETVSGLKLASPTNMPTCTLANGGVMRLAADNKSIEICDGAAVPPAWTPLGSGGGGGGSIDSLTDAATEYTSKLNMFLGDQSGAASGSGSFNTGLGVAALGSNTSGSWNTALGTDALYSNTSGTGNTAVGLAALMANTSSNNTAVGVSALAKNTTGQEGTAVGGQALAMATTGGYNSAVGYSALNMTTTGYGNVAMGNKALFSNTTGNLNTAVGFRALNSNTAGSLTAVGAAALKANTTGSSNTAVGYNALSNNTTGGSNSAVGNAALYSNTTGNLNTAVGDGALYFNSTGYNNVGLGRRALYRGNTSHDNTAAGTFALSENTTGNYNSVQGSQSLQWNTTGSWNTAMGFYAMKTNVTGNYNTTIGASADVTAPDISNSMALGFNAKATGSNEIVLGNSDITAIYANVTSISAISDQRLKRDIEGLNLGLDFLLKLRPVEYRFNNGDETLRYGFIAQEVEAALPDVLQRKVETSAPEKGLALLSRQPDKDRTFRLSYGELTAPLVKAVQEIAASVKQLVANDNKTAEDIAELKRQIDSLQRAQRGCTVVQ